MAFEDDGLKADIARGADDVARTLINLFVIAQNQVG